MGWVLGNDDKAEADALVKEKMGADEAPMDELKAMGASAFVEAAKENPVGGEAEVNVEPKIGDFGLCQPEPKTLEGALLELRELLVEEEAEELPPKPNTPEAPLPKELAALIAEAETEAPPPKPNIGVAGPLLEPTVLVEGEEELKPNTNVLGVAVVLELTADPSEPALGVALNLNKLDVGPPAGTTEVVSDGEVVLLPKLMLGVGNEPREALVFILNAGTDADETDTVVVPCERVPTPDTEDLVALAKSEP